MPSESDPSDQWVWSTLDRILNYLLSGTESLGIFPIQNTSYLFTLFVCFMLNKKKKTKQKTTTKKTSTKNVQQKCEKVRKRTNK